MPFLLIPRPAAQKPEALCAAGRRFSVRTETQPAVRLNLRSPPLIFLAPARNAAFFSVLRGTPLFFPSTTGNAAAFSSALPEMPAAAFLFSDNVCAGQSLLFCRRAPRAGQSRAGVAHRTQAVWREEFSRHSAPQPGYAQAARRQISRAAAFAASRFLFVPLFFDLLRGEGFSPALRAAAIASGRRRRRAMLLSACPSAGRSGRGSARRL